MHFFKSQALKPTNMIVILEEPKATERVIRTILKKLAEKKAKEKKPIEDFNQHKEKLKKFNPLYLGV